MLATKGGGSSTGQVCQVSEGPHCRPFREGAFQMPRVNMWGLSLYCCDSHRCYTAEQRLLTLGNQSCSQLPAGQTRKRGLLPRSGGMRSPFGRGSSQFGRRRWRWQPTFPWEEPFLQTAAIRQAKTVTFLYSGSLKFTSEIKKTTLVTQSSNPKQEEKWRRQCSGVPIFIFISQVCS